MHIVFPCRFSTAACISRVIWVRQLQTTDSTCRGRLSSQVLGKQTVQSAYMLPALWVTGSLLVHGAFCLICSLWCSYQNNLIPESLCYGSIEGHVKEITGGQTCWMALTSPPNRNIFWIFFICMHKYALWCSNKYERTSAFWKVRYFCTHLHFICTICMTFQRGEKRGEKNTTVKPNGVLLPHFQFFPRCITFSRKKIPIWS